MGTIRLLTESDLRRLVPLDADAVACVDSAFATLAGGKVVMPPILSMPIAEHNGEIDVKTAYVPGLPAFAVKMSPGFFDNPAKGLPSTSGLMVVFSTETGMVEALLLDNGYLTDVRTAAAGAVATRHLAREDAATAAILGTGQQAALQLEALTLVRPLTRALIWGRDPDKAAALAARLDRPGLRVRAAADPAAAVAAADIVVTTTPATAPILDAEWLRPGVHITAMGSDQHSKNELDPRAIVRAERYVADRLAQTRVLGELRSAIEAGLVAPDAPFDELGGLCAGTVPGRRHRDEITLADLTGTGVQDTAIATLALARATAASAGVSFQS